MPVFKWSKTANANATADPTINWAEGQAPSSVNDSARALMAAVAGWRDDSSGLLATTGSGTAYVVTTNQGLPFGPADGQLLTVTVHATNNANASLQADSGGVYLIQSAPGVNIPAGVLIQGTPYALKFCASTTTWIVQGFFGNPYNVPIGAGMDFWGSVTPNSSFAFAQGQAISRTTYATLFSLIGTAFGVGDGGSTFNLPDKVGRVSVAADPGGSRITGATFNFTTLGGVGGQERIILNTGNLPPYTPAGSTTVSGQNAAAVASTFSYNPGGNPLTVTQPTTATNNLGSVPLAVSGVSAALTGTPQGGTSTPFTNVQPAIVCNHIIRII